jgi:hypothetical protein
VLGQLGFDVQPRQPAGISRRFALALAWIGAATVPGAVLPLLGVVVFASFLAHYWLPVSGELGVARPPPGRCLRRGGSGDEEATLR